MGDFGSNVRTMVLVGRTGDGKSATGNSILGRKLFESMSSSAGVTTTCELRTAVMEDGQILNVIDTPGFFRFSAKPELNVMKEIMDMAKDGIHAFVLVLSVRTRFTREDEAALHTLCKVSDKKIADYMIVVFTGGDDLENNEQTLDGYLGGDCPDPLKDILKMCGNRCVLFDNKTKDVLKKSEQLKKLLQLVNEVVDRNSGEPYTAADVLFDDPKEQLHESHEVDVNGMMEMVKEKTWRIEQQLEDERKARLEAECLALAAIKNSSDEIRSLTQRLELTQDQTEELRHMASSNILRKILRFITKFFVHQKDSSQIVC